jgi:hypothetical protein
MLLKYALPSYNQMFCLIIQFKNQFKGLIARALYVRSLMDSQVETRFIFNKCNISLLITSF